MFVAENIRIGGVASFIRLNEVTMATESEYETWNYGNGSEKHLNTSFQYSLTKFTEVQGIPSAEQRSLTRE